jgi:hypothetical protein
LHTLINHPVIFSQDVLGPVPEKISAHMNNGDVVLVGECPFPRGRREE